MLSGSILLRSLSDSLQFGQALATVLPDDSICLLEGDLGAGKTTIIRAIAAALGANPGLVTSPTYTISNWYEGAASTIYHVDLYRLKSTHDLYAMDQDDWLNPAGPTFIEWPQIALPFLKDIPYLRMQLAKPAATSSQRHLSMTAASPFYENVFLGLNNHRADADE
ncbi:MAG: tRNA (adenosine(37)-N6)-threonylcarbamoyltransferase complex ATPase subunit type 1 TsaE [Gammaproteobacteria bacterium]|nr:tRNA (adenosine(37)-N6)-threonylcarbamoyltransferase complex ATPase subunit type 1 TsaE [Gammaproteobacteria bacterium]